MCKTELGKVYIWMTGGGEWWSGGVERLWWLVSGAELMAACGYQGRRQSDRDNVSDVSHA